MIDKLNVISKKKSIPYNQYFGDMGITSIQKKKRIKFAEELEDVFYVLFLMILNDYLDGVDLDEYYYSEFLERRYFDVVVANTDYLENDDKSIQYVKDISKLIVSATIVNITNDYYTSDDRCVFVSENESNTIMNYDEHIDAIVNGKSHKKWITMNDKYVRHSHISLEGKTIGIFESFKVGNSKMDFPRDDSYGASDTEIVNCRCSIKYY
ncbi:MAG: hypothetical protein KBT03_01395 [Bacteroidales bacterium]|nr:hypothetical protein [Candidatus Scybalousia scybalohippi]